MAEGVLIALVMRANRNEVNKISEGFERLGYYPDDSRRKKQYIVLCLNQVHGTADRTKLEQIVTNVMGGE